MPARRNAQTPDVSTVRRDGPRKMDGSCPLCAPGDAMATTSLAVAAFGTSTLGGHGTSQELPGNLK